jgi:hypothetical protein
MTDNYYTSRKGGEDHESTEADENFERTGNKREQSGFHQYTILKLKGGQNHEKRKTYENSKCTGK